jgi:hypothetical protein
MYHRNQSACLARHVAILGLAILSLAACSSGPDISNRANNGANELIDAATGPLEDLNLKRKDIPPVLEALLTDPYAHPKKMECKAIQEELTQLDDLLGPDYDSGKIKLQLASANSDEIKLPEMPDTDTLVDTGESMAHDGIMGFIHSQTNIMPFRSLIRLVSGADRHEKEVKQAYQAGQLRRAYLKGVAEDRFGPSCLMPPGVIEARATHAS